MFGQARKTCGTKMERRSVSSSLAKKFDGNQKQIAKMLSQLGKQIEKLDPTLKGTVERRAQENRVSVDKLRRKTGPRTDQKTGLISRMNSIWNPLLIRTGPAGAGIVPAAVLARWEQRADELQKHSTGKKNRNHFIVQLP